MVLSGGTIKHQHHQPTWQAHMAQYRPPLGIPTWQTMRLQDPSLLPCAQPPSIFPQLSREMQVRPHKSPNSQQLQQLSPISSSSSSLRAKKPHGGGGFASEGAPQLQLLCHAQRMWREYNWMGSDCAFFVLFIQILTGACCVSPSWSTMQSSWQHLHHQKWQLFWTFGNRLDRTWGITSSECRCAEDIYPKQWWTGTPIIPDAFMKYGVYS